MCGRTLCRRVGAEDDVRSNIHADGSAKTVKITDRELRLAELIRPKLQADGMFLVGIDIIGDTILEVNVFSPQSVQLQRDEPRQLRRENSPIDRTQT